MNNSSLSTLHPQLFFCTGKLVWNRKWSLSLVPAKPTKWLLYDEFVKNLMLWEERRVFTVSELSKVEQGAKVWFLFGSQGTWHTKCFCEGKKGRSDSEFSEISWFPFGWFAGVAFLGNSPFLGKVWSSSESTASLQQNMALGENAGLLTLRNTRERRGVARLGMLHVTMTSVRFLQISIFFWDGTSGPWKIWRKCVPSCFHLQVVYWRWPTMAG